MDTVRHSNGYVIGFDRLNIDPMSTRRRVLAELKDTGFLATIEGTQQAAKGAVTVTHSKDGDTIHYAPNYGQLVAEHKAAVQRYDSEYKRLTDQLVMYFQPRAGEVVLPADELAVLRERFAALKPGQKLTLKGEVVDVTESG